MPTAKLEDEQVLGFYCAALDYGKYYCIVHIKVAGE